MFKSIISNPEKIRQCRRDAKEVREKRSFNSKRTSEILSTIILDRYKLKPKPKIIMEPVVDQEKWEKVRLLKQKIKEAITMKKFLDSQKYYVIRKYVRIDGILLG